MQINDLYKYYGGEGGIRTHVPVTRQDAFEAPPLRPLRYLSQVVRAGCSRDGRRANISLYRAATLSEKLLNKNAAGLLKHASREREAMIQARQVEPPHR